MDKSQYGYARPVHMNINIYLPRFARRSCLYSTLLSQEKRRTGHSSFFLAASIR